MEGSGLEELPCFQPSAEYANRQSGQVESLVKFVGSTPTSATAEWSRGPAATTPGPHPGNDGSSPSGITAGLQVLQRTEAIRVTQGRKR